MEQRRYQASYEGPYGGPGHRQAQGEKVLSRRQRRRLFSWPFLIVVVLGILALSGFMTARYDRPWSRGHHERDVFQVADDAKLMVNDDDGKVYVHTGDYHHISVTAITYSSRYARESEWSGQDRQEGLSVSTDMNAYSVDSHTVVVNATDLQRDGKDGSSPVDLDITVPETTSLAIHSTTGAVTVEDVKGNIQVATTHGNIELDSTEGDVSLTTSTGNIELSDVQLSGSSSLKTSAGNIDFDGSLDPYGSYDFETRDGSTDITLPDSSAFHLTTITQNNASIDNDFHDTSVGDGQQASLTIHTSSGHIAIHQDD